MFFDRLVSVYHLTKNASNNWKESYALDAGLDQVKMQIQPSAPDDVAIVEGVYGQTYNAFTTCSGIHHGDKIIDNISGDKYRVAGLENWALTDLIPHFEMTLMAWVEEEG